MSAWRMTRASTLSRDAREGVEAVRRDEAPVLDAREARRRHLLAELGDRRDPPASRRHGAPEVQDVHGRAPAETERRQEQPATVRQEAADVAQHRDALLDREV